jgi:glycosyltransferase involved in cell wall biosynthesis
MLHSCARTFKYGWQQLIDGHRVHLITERFISAHPWGDFYGVHVVNTGQLAGHEINLQQIGETVEELSPIMDVFHVHNEPDWLVSLVRKASDKPIVYDIHDMVSVRTGKDEPDEDKSIINANAICTVSSEYVDRIRKKLSNDKPVVEVLSCVPSYLFPKKKCKLQHNGLVYEGGMRGIQEISEQYPYRNWLEAFRAITKEGLPVWAYSNSSAENLRDYAKASVQIMGPLHLDELLCNLTAHEVGILGSPTPDPAFDGALPNKLFEYIAAGLPVIALNAPTARRFLEATGMGVGVNRSEERRVGKEC